MAVAVEVSGSLSRDFKILSVKSMGHGKCSSVLEKCCSSLPPVFVCTSQEVLRTFQVQASIGNSC